jgi:hypothetical protein
MDEVKKVCKIHPKYIQELSVLLVLLLVALLLGIVSIILTVIKPLNLMAAAVALVLTGSFLGLSIKSYKNYQRSLRYELQLFNDRIRIQDDGSRIDIPLSDIQHLSVRGNNQQIEILDQSKRSLGSISPHLSEVSELIKTLMGVIKKPSVDPLTGDLRIRIKGSFRIFLKYLSFITGIFLICILVDLQKWYGYLLFLSPALIIGLIRMLKSVRWIEISNQTLEIKTARSQTTINRGNILSLELYIPSPTRSNESIDVIVKIQGGQEIFICPNNQDPFSVYWTLRHFLNLSGEVTISHKS